MTITDATAASPATARVQYHHGDLRQALVDAARAMLAKQGVESFTLREVARQVGVNHRAAYRHFEDKQALLAAVAQEGYEVLLAQTHARLDALPAAADAEQKLIIALCQYVEFSLAHSAEYRVMMGSRLTLDSRFPQLEALVSEAFALVKRLVKNLSTAQTWDSVRVSEATVALLSMTHGFSDLVLMDRIHVKVRPVNSFVARLVRGVLHGHLPL
jgi:AcrR family transcriptional regulator